MKVETLVLETYLKVIENSLGAKTYRNFFALVDGVKKDILENGELSCAFYASSILVLFRLVKFSHTTVKTTVSDMLEIGWIEITEPKIGAVLVWEEVDFGRTGMHSHIGFYMGENKAISNSSSEGFPSIHDWTFDGKRKISKILFHEKLK